MYNLKILKAVADETRLDILLTLLKGEKTVSEITEIIKKSQPNTSIALKKLENVDLISMYKDKRNVIYKMKNKELVEKLLSLIKNG